MFIACGLNHKTAPIALREKIALPVAMQEKLLNSLIDLPAINEAAILSTCNRTEIYCDTDKPSKIVSWLACQHQLSPEFLSPYLYVHQDDQGIRHTLRVASGLDSMMLGEPQILGQMKQAYQQACRLGTIKSTLRPVFEYIFSASKRVRHRSGIGSNPVSIAYAAVQLVGQLFPNFKDLKVLIIGSGETASLVAKYLYKQGVRHFFVASRSNESAQQLATIFNGKALSISDIPSYLAQAGVVISATACPLPFIDKNMVALALDKRNPRSMLFLDLAVPRDIAAEVAELPSVKLYNIDDLHQMIDKGMHERRLAALTAEELIDYELNNYTRWHRTLQAKKTICDYRQQMQVLAQQELQRAKGKLLAGYNQEILLEEFCNRLVNKLTHHTTVGLRQTACEGREELLDLAHYLFNSSFNRSTYEEIA